MAASLSLRANLRYGASSQIPVFLVCIPALISLSSYFDYSRGRIHVPGNTDVTGGIRPAQAPQPPRTAARAGENEVNIGALPIAVVRCPLG